MSPIEECARRVVKSFKEWDETSDMMLDGETLNALHELCELCAAPVVTDEEGEK